MSRRAKRTIQIGGALVALLVVAVLGFAGTNVMAFNASTTKVYAVPLAQITRSTDPAVLARGQHLAESLGGCTSCHGANLGGGRLEEMGPIGRIRAPNLTRGKNGVGAAYSDAELARVVRHGVRRDGTSVRFMPSRDFNWWPDSDVAAVVSFVRSVPDVDGEAGLVEISAFGRILDRLDAVPLDSARRIDHDAREEAPPPSASKEYGAYVARLCIGCHGEHLSGGRIPGTPPDVPMPLNLTPHASGLAGWSADDLAATLRIGKRKSGAQLHPFMPRMPAMDDTEVAALFAYLQSVPALPLGER